jgi:CheY-like chemotaxis protein
MKPLSDLDPKARPNATMPAPPTADGDKPTSPPGEGPYNLTPLDLPFELPERAFFQQLDDRARRAELMNALLQAGGLPPESAVRALQAALGAIIASAEDANLPTLANLSSALRSAIGNLGIGEAIFDDMRVVDTLVLDESELSRDLVALAVEAQGHTVRCAATWEDFVKELERRPGLIITEVQHSNAPAKSFCSILQELLVDMKIPVVFFSDLETAELAELARKYGAQRAISKELGVDRLIVELRDVYRAIFDLRTTSARTRFHIADDEP